MGCIDKGLPFDINDFKSESPKSDGQPIQVIGSSTSTTLPKELTDFNIDEFFKSIMPESYQQNNAAPSQSNSVPLPVPPVSNDYSMNTSIYADLPGLSNYGSQQSPVDLPYAQQQQQQQQSQNVYRPPPPMPQAPPQMNPYNNNNIQPRPPPPNNSYNLRGPPNPAFNQPYSTSMHNNYHGGLPPVPLQRPRYPPPPPNQINNFNMPLAPPPLPPAFDGNLSDEYNPESWDLEMSSWNSSQQDDSFNQTIETPVSPPHYEREGSRESIILEYIDTAGNENSGSGDVDHRQLRLPNIPMTAISSKDKGRVLDVDHRNLISLTGSPGPKIGNDIPPPPLQPPNMWKGDMVCTY